MTVLGMERREQLQRHDRGERSMNYHHLDGRIAGIRKEKSLLSFQVTGKMTAIKTKNTRMS